jgi:hypothetical protein
VNFWLRAPEKAHFKLIYRCLAAVLGVQGVRASYASHIIYHRFIAKGTYGTESVSVSLSVSYKACQNRDQQQYGPLIPSRVAGHTGKHLLPSPCPYSAERRRFGFMCDGTLAHYHTTVLPASFVHVGVVLC